MNELRVVSLEGSGFPQPRRIYGNAEIDFFDPTDWPPDGKWLAVKVTRRDLTRQIAIVGVQDGSFRALKTVGWRGPNKMFFSPDGKYLAYDLPPSDEDAQRDVLIIAIDGSSETRAVEHPSDDVVMGWSADGARLLFASDRTGAVALWVQPIVGGKPHGAPTMLKPEIGSISSQGLTASGVLHIVKDSSTVSLQVAPIDLGAGKLAGPPVLENFRSGRPDWTNDGKLFAYKTVTPNNLQTLSVRANDSSQVRRVPIALQYMGEPRWMPDGVSVVAHGRALKGRGGIFRIDAQTGRSTLVTELDGNTGRVQVSPDGRKIYYDVGGSALQSAIPALVERDLTTGEVREVFRRGSGTGGAELSPDGRLFAVVSTENGKTSTVLIFAVAGGPPRELFRVNLPDALQAYGGITWTPDSQAVVVVNTTREAGGGGGQPKELWLVPVSGGKARKLDVDTRGWLGQGIRLHPNGKQIAFFTGQDLREVWAIATGAPTATKQSANK